MTQRNEKRTSFHRYLQYNKKQQITTKTEIKLLKQGEKKAKKTERKRKKTDD